ncbi:MAG: DUF6132 family protein [Bacteroidales bacterium]|nr:DUF6132 family protein [Bacteroidales bacterium]
MDIFVSSKILKIVVGVIIGGVVGYLYYRFIGCSSGTCPITSNKFSSIIYGGFMGYLIAS